MGSNYKYNAFISYRHISPDKEIADKLQKKLENYKPPKSVSPGNRRGGLRVFRDETELPTSSDLSNDIKAALEESEYLIVICSKTTGESRWCMEEIEYFKQLHNGSNSNIITLVADGKPEEVFPSALCNESIPVTDESGNITYQTRTIEPLAANVSSSSLKESFKKLNTEFLRIAAPILGCGYDSLYNREHKKKIRKIFTVGGIILSLLLLFSVYNSAMLWQINNQKITLAKTNKDLQKKTEELNLINDDLKKTNEELAKKTKEAEDNLAEAEKQRKAAEDNLAEAEKQRKAAEDSSAEADKQRKAAEYNFTEAEKQRKAAEDSSAEADRQRKAAEDNLAEAEKQKKAAEDNLTEAEKQKKAAEDNLAEAEKQKKAAEDNLAEANRQKQIADTNAEEANTQRTIAEENMKTAQENEAKANEANRNLRIKNSEILANQSKIYLENDDIFPAITTALEALSQEDEDIPSNSVAKYVLSTAINAYKPSEKMVNRKINLSGYINFLEFSEDGTRLFAKDNTGNIYVIDYDKNKIIQTFTPTETFGAASTYIRDICIDKNTGFVLTFDQLISVNLNNGSINWHYHHDDIYNIPETIVTNPNSPHIIIMGSSTCIYLSKDNGDVFTIKDKNYDYNSYNDYSYMDSAGTVYIIRPESSYIHRITKSGITLHPFEITNKDKVLCVGENDKYLFLNIALEQEDLTSSITPAKIICINKNDMSVKWATNYTTGNLLSTLYYNTIFEFTHNLPDETGEFKKHTGVLVVSDRNLLCFDIETGELYYSVTENYERRILYCAPNTTEYSLKIATPKLFLKTVYLANNQTDNDSSDTSEEYLLCTNWYEFDEERKYIAHAEEDKFALASNNSSEINIYHLTTFNNNKAFNNYPSTNGNLDFMVDDGNGTFAAFYYDYVEAERKHHIIIYDSKNNVCKAFFEETLDISNMVFKDNKLLMIDNKGNAKVVDYSGNILEEFDLLTKINESTEADLPSYVSFNQPYIHLSKTNVVICISHGIFTINLSGEKVQVKEVISGSNLGNYCIDGNFVSFMTNPYGNSKIVYFADGDKEISYVSENGSVVEFPRNSISSITNSKVGNKIAFINREGYIGIFSYGGDSITKISLPKGEIVPLDLKFTPDGNSLITMCADGRFIKYDINTGEITGEYKSESSITDYAIFEFMDDKSFYIRKYETSGDIVIIDINSMQKLAEVQNFINYLKSERKIIYRIINSEGSYEVGYYNYLTDEELIELATAFIEGK